MMSRAWWLLPFVPLALIGCGSIGETMPDESTCDVHELSQVFRQPAAYHEKVFCGTAYSGFQSGMFSFHPARLQSADDAYGYALLLIRDHEVQILAEEPKERSNLARPAIRPHSKSPSGVFRSHSPKGLWCWSWSPSSQPPTDRIYISRPDYRFACLAMVAVQMPPLSDARSRFKIDWSVMRLALRSDDNPSGAYVLSSVHVICLRVRLLVMTRTSNQVTIIVRIQRVQIQSRSTRDQNWLAYLLS